MKSKSYRLLNGGPQNAKKAPKLLAPIIDVLLMTGGMTMLGVVRELRRKASASCRGKDLQANVRARLYWFKRKGCTVDTDELGRFGLFPPA